MKKIIKKQALEYSIFFIFSILITLFTFFITDKMSFQIGEISGRSVYYGWPRFFYHVSFVTGTEEIKNFIHTSFLYDIIIWFVITIAINTIIKLAIVAFEKIKFILFGEIKK